jgi:DNA-binding transcriptional MerR regulator
MWTAAESRPTAPMPSPSIPDKLYFKIGEVSEIIGVKPYVLRYWETEFKDIVPVKSRTNQRLYRRKDVELIIKIRDLLHGQRFTINGAKKRLKGEVKEEKVTKVAPQLGLELSEPKQTSTFSPEIINELKTLLGEMKESIS